MDSRYAGFDLEAFANSIAAGAIVQQQQHAQQQQQQQQQHVYGSQNGPTLENYDPTARTMIDPSLAMAAYNSSTQRSTTTTLNHRHVHQRQHHRTMMPSASSSARGGNSNRQSRSPPSASPTRGIGGVPAPSLFGFPDFEPLPLSKTSAQAASSSSATSRHHQSSTNNSSLSMVAPGPAGMLQANPQLIDDDFGAAALFTEFFGNGTSTAAAAASSSTTSRSSRHHSRSTSSSRSRGNNSSRGGSSSMTSMFTQQNHHHQHHHHQHQAIQQIPRQPQLRQPIVREEWLEKLFITVSGLSLEPLSGTVIVDRLRDKADDVVTRYLPCVDFLVQCQQDLRKGLAAAQQKRLVHHMLRDAMTPRQFYNTYISPLPERFYRKNIRIMDKKVLDDAVQGIQKLCKDARGVELQGCEVMKNTFLGGMKDGESWGLRKWLSKNGGALHICNDCECILNACQKLDRNENSTSKLAELLRPLAKHALTRLKADVPSSYQEVSTAHPYLPFFHRLESTLKGMSSFDPEDDDVICIDDDDEIEEEKAKAAAAVAAKKQSNQSNTNGRKRGRSSSSGKTSSSSGGGTANKKHRSNSGREKSHSVSKKASEPAENGQAQQPSLANDGGDDDDDDSVIEVFDVKPPSSKASKKAMDDSSNINAEESPISKVKNNSSNINTEDSPISDPGSDDDYMTALFSTLDDATTELFDNSSHNDNGGTSPTKDMIFAAAAMGTGFGARDMAVGIDRLAGLFDSNHDAEIRPRHVEKSEFWDYRGHYASALRLFSDILREPGSSIHLDRNRDADYCQVIKHPLCFRDIFAALLEDDDDANNFYANDSESITRSSSDGLLPNQGLSGWNMWRGLDLLQAIDLVFLNSLAYGKSIDEGKSSRRSQTNKLRKDFWDGIKRVLDSNVTDVDQELRRRCTPTRRGEASGFVVHKR